MGLLVIRPAYDLDIVESFSEAGDGRTKNLFYFIGFGFS